MHRARPRRLATLVEALRARAGSGHREQRSRDVYQPEQYGLAQLELRPEANHRMEYAAREAPAAVLDKADVLRQPPKLGEARPQIPAQPARRIPPAVEPRGADQARQPLTGGLPRQHHVARDLEMLVHRFARDEQVHDFRRAFEDQIDAEVAHDALDRHRLLAARA